MKIVWMKIVWILMGSVALANSGIYIQPRSLADFFFIKKTKIRPKGNKSLLTDHGLLKKTMLGILLIVDFDCWMQRKITSALCKVPFLEKQEKAAKTAIFAILIILHPFGQVFLILS